MSHLSNLFRWLSGSFTCMKCGCEVHLMTLGFGKTICPTCYQGEQQFILMDDKYWLNRIILKFKSVRPKIDVDSELSVEEYLTLIQHEVEVPS